MRSLDPNQIPIHNIVQGFLSAMIKYGAKTFVVFQHDNQAAIAMNHQDAEATARNLLTIKDGALDVAAAALHAFRFTADTQLDACSLHPCALVEKEAGAPIPWDDLPQEVKDAHRLVAGAIVGAAIAYNPPKPKIISGE